MLRKSRHLCTFILTLQLKSNLTQEKQRHINEAASEYMDDCVISINYLISTESGDPIRARRLVISGIHNRFAVEFAIAQPDLPEQPTPNNDLNSIINSALNIEAFALPQGATKPRGKTSSTKPQQSEKLEAERLESENIVNTLQLSEPATKCFHLYVNTQREQQIIGKLFAVMYNMEQNTLRKPRRIIMPSEYILAYLTDCPQTCINKLRAAVVCGKYDKFHNIVTTLTPFQVSNTIVEHFYTNFIGVASSRSMTIPCNIIKCQ